MIHRGELARALLRRKVAAWVVLERAQELAIADDARSLRRHEKRTRTTLIVHHDQPRGRGTAHLDLAASDTDAAALVDQALSLANTAIGPAWKSVPAAAPAKVSVFDPELDKRALDDAAAGVLAALRSPTGVSLSSSVTVMREQVSVQSHAGFHARWTASMVQADVLVSARDRSLAITRDARRLADLDLDAAIASAAADLDHLASATAAASAAAPSPGRCALVLTADALLHGGAPGMWSVFAAQADAVLERQGLTRYRLGSPVATGADKLDEPLTITSDGALDFATRSAPVGADGDAVRRFALVERGLAAGLGLSPREAALRRSEPNGGVRNLVVAPGTWVEQFDPNTRTIEVRRLRALSIDPYTGDATLELAVAIDHEGAKPRAFTGGTIRLDLISALAHARRSAITIRRGAYHGPASVLIENAELLA